MPYFEHQQSLELSIVIVSYNVRELLRACLTSVLHSSRDISREIIVVDNNSADASARMLETDFPEVILIAQPRNLGFVKANNIAFRRCRGRVILMLNPDTYVLSDSFREMLRFLEKEPTVAALGCKMLYEDRTVQPSCYNFPSLREIFGMYFWGGRRFSGLRQMDYDSRQEVDFCRGAFLALKRNCLEQVGLLDEKIFMFAEETDLCYRLKSNGWKTLYWPQMVIIHHQSKSIATRPDAMYVERIRSLIYFFAKHYGRYSTFLLRVIIFAGVGLRLLLRKYTKDGFSSGKERKSRGTLLAVLKLAVGLAT